MPNSALKDIRAALASRLLAIQSSDTPPIAWESGGYQPTTGTLHLSEAIIPAGKVTPGTSAADAEDYEGIYQVTVRVKSGSVTDRFEAEEQARLVEDHFPRAATYTRNAVTVKVLRTETVVGFVEDGWYNLPVEIHYRALV